MQTTLLRRLRPWVQAAAFLLFVALVLGAGRTGWLPADLFFRLDPLTGLAGMLAGRQIVLALLIGGLITLLLTVALGRVWCGWLCPLGTALDWTPAAKIRPKTPDLPPRWRQVKHFLLALILVAALLGNLSFIWLDPITLLYRTITTAIWPALLALLWQAELLLYNVPFLRGLVDAIEGTRGALLPLAGPVYGAGALVAVLFIGILALNAIRPRFWCRYLCPLGALLGLVSKVAWLRRAVGETCSDCQRCARACPTGTIDPGRGFASDPAECTMCLDCVPVCQRLGQHFRGHWQPALWRPYDPTRRQLLASAGAALAVAGLAAVEPTTVHPQPHLIRPPGARDPDFTSRCIRCGLCLKVCPTAGLQPSLAAAGWSGLWTPVLVPRLGHCDYTCVACGEVCPTAAIPRLALSAKQQTVIGQAYIDRDRCIPWADGRTCLVCEEMCPLPEKAIQLEEAAVTGADGVTTTVRRPHVLHDRCTGCGICENRCPLAGEAAIRVYAAG